MLLTKLTIDFMPTSSHVGATAQNYQYPWSIKLDRSSVSLNESEGCGSASTVLTNSNNCKSLVSYNNVSTLSNYMFSPSEY
jgi:hypothetical protein